MISDDHFHNAVLSLSGVTADCPWCGESQEWVIDPTNAAAYVEDCFVCCRPCLIQPLFDEGGVVSGVQLEQE
ncbi:MAG: hypothetical protein Tsb002_25450 [Wenzhouxiangellaceae bacterium]